MPARHLLLCSGFWWGEGLDRAPRPVGASSRRWRRRARVARAGPAVGDRPPADGDREPPHRGRRRSSPSGRLDPLGPRRQAVDRRRPDGRRGRRRAAGPGRRPAGRGVGRGGRGLLLAERSASGAREVSSRSTMPGAPVRLAARRAAPGTPQRLARRLRRPLPGARPLRPPGHRLPRLWLEQRYRRRRPARPGRAARLGRSEAAPRRATSLALQGRPSWPASGPTGCRPGSRCPSPRWSAAWSSAAGWTPSSRTADGSRAATSSTGRPGRRRPGPGRRPPVQLGAYRLAWSRLPGVPVEHVGAAFFHASTGETLWPELPGTDEITAVLGAARP